MVSQLRRKYATGYKSLQKEWVKESKELLYVGRLAYWTYWVSKWAESSFKMKEVDELNALKKNAFKVLLKSAYSQLKKYCPRFSKKCDFIMNRCIFYRSWIKKLVAICYLKCTCHIWN